MRRIIGLLAAAALVLTGGAAGAQAQTCDFVTGGGYIVNNDAKANFGVGGSCKLGGDGHVLWGHLEYIDHGADLNVHWTTITGYFACDNPDPSDLSTQCSPNPSGQPPATRLICGTARTNQTSADVNWAVAVTDNGGKNTDFFSIRVPDLSGYHASGFLQGGNIQLHKPIFSGSGTSSCPALAAGPTTCSVDTDCNFPQVCIAGVCGVAGTCTSDADCGTDGSCDTSTDTCCPANTAFDPNANPPRCCQGGICMD